MPIKKYTDSDLKVELIRIFGITNKIPTIDEWNKLSSIRSETIQRRFGSWKDCWLIVNINYIKENEIIIKNNIINNIKEAFIKQKPTTASELVKLSGHNLTTIYKYFGSLEVLLDRSKINLNNIVNNEDLIEDLKLIVKTTKAPISKKSLKLNGKFSPSLYIKRFNSVNNINNLLLVDISKTKISENELLEHLKSLSTKLNRTPTNKDLVDSDFSPNAYRRAFGGLKIALNKIGLKQNTRQINNICYICNANVKFIISHFEKNHPSELKEQENKIIDLYKNGNSAHDIATNPNIIHNGTTSILRVVRKYLSKSEIGTLRKKKITKTLQDKYTAGELDWVKQLSTNSVIKDSVREKISKNISNKYNNGEMKSWSKGLTKDNSNVIKSASKKQSDVLTHLHNTGQIDKAIGSNSGRWVKERDNITPHYRLGIGFSKKDRLNIKERAYFKCELCGKDEESIKLSGKFLECDHIIPLANGGINDWQNNGQALCTPCHLNKTLGREIKFNYIDKISTSINCNLDEILKYSGSALTKQYINSLTRTEKIKLSYYLYDFFSKYDFYKAEYSKTILDTEFNSLVNSECVITNNVISNKNNIGVKICKNYFPNINKVNNPGKKSIQDVLSDNDLLLGTIRNRIGLDDSIEECFNISPSTIVRGAKNSFRASRGSLFKPYTAKIIYNYWTKDGDIVYDYSAGFGGRILGNHVSGKNTTYIGCEPNKETYNGLLKIIKYYGIKAEIHCIGSENFVPSKPINFAFSSPPYFNCEIYSDDSKQCYNKYKEYENWLENYWKQTVINIKSVLANDGVFGINVGNSSNDFMRLISRDMTEIIEKENFILIDKWYMETLSFGSNSNKLENIYFYKLYK